jgi:hypothetical protein
MQPRSSTPSAAQRTALVQQLVALGYRGQDLASLVKAGRTREEIAQDLISLQRTHRKAR